MTTIALPATVSQAWGSQVATDFASWFEQQLSQIRHETHLPISAFVARQKVNVLMLEHVSHMLLAGEPKLIQKSTQEWVWQVPIDLTYPSKGRVGQVGQIEVEAYHGEIQFTAALLTQITTRMEQLAQEIALVHP
jgi:hypothetical protein